MVFGKKVIKAILGGWDVERGIDNKDIEDAGYDISYTVEGNGVGVIEKINIKKDGISVLNYSNNLLSNCSTKPILNFVDDEDAYVALQVMIMQDLYGGYVSKKVYSLLTEPMVNCRWTQYILPSAILYWQDMNLQANLIDNYESIVYEDITYDMPWYVVATITSLGKNIDESVPLQHFDGMFISDAEYNKIITGTCNKNGVEFYSILDSDDNMVLVVYYHKHSCKTDIQIFDEDGFWSIYENILRNIQF